MNYEEIAQFCYNNRPTGALFADDEYWNSVIGQHGHSPKDSKLIFLQLIDMNYFHKLNNRNYILNYKYFRKYGGYQYRNA